MARPVSRAPCRVVQEVAILQALRTTTDPRARQRLQGDLLRVGEWLPQIKAIARRWACEAIEPEEFESAGVMGLLEAAGRFDGGDGEGWPTYATTWIRRRVQELARAQQGPLVAETQWEQRTARRQRTERRPRDWSPVEVSASKEEGLCERGGLEKRRCNRHSEVCAAMKDMQAAGEDQAAREEQRQALPVALSRLAPWARSSLAQLTGERAGPLPELEEVRGMLRRAALRMLRKELEG